MPTPARLATAAIGAPGSATNTSRAASRIRWSLRVACALRPLGILRSCASPSNTSHLTSLCNAAGLITPSRSTGGVQPMETHPAVRPFRVDVAEEDLDDLRRRIEATRWPSKELVEDRSQGP